MAETHPDVVVVGAGVAGLHAALNLAETGYNVCLVEKKPTAGGLLTGLDHQFPNNHCGLCRLLPMLDREGSGQFCLKRGFFHEKIRLLTSTEVREVEGQAGRFTIRLESAWTGVDPGRCLACGRCETVCPVSLPDPENGGLGRIKAIHLPGRHYARGARVIDWGTCTRCGLCLAECPSGAINLDGKPRLTELEDVGAVLLAPGAELYDPSGVDLYGMDRWPNVVTSLVYERMLSESPGHQARLPRPSDRKPVKKVAWLQCVGSRNLMIGADYCSRACCMFAVKEALLTRESHPEIDTAIFYMDMRTYGRDFQRYRDRAEHEAGVRFVRARVHSIDPGDDPNELVLKYAGPDGQAVQETFDLVVLSTGQDPLARMPEWADQEGVFTAHVPPGLTDIQEAVIGAGAASARLQAWLKTQGRQAGGHASEGPLIASNPVFLQRPRPQVVLTPILLNDTTSEPGGADVFWARLESERDNLPGRAVFTRLDQTSGADRIDRVAKALDPAANRLILVSFGPVWTRTDTLDLADRTGFPAALIERVELDPGMVAGVEPDRAVTRAVDEALWQVRTAAARLMARRWRKPARPEVNRAALIVGGGPAGLSAALALADLDVKVTLVDKAESLGGHAERILDPQTREAVGDLAARVASHPRVDVQTRTEVVRHLGRPGAFVTQVRDEQGRETKIPSGAVILAVGGRSAETGAYAMGRHPRIAPVFDLERTMAGQPVGELVLIHCAGSREEPRNYCGRVCCLASLRAALRIREANPEARITVFYRDMMTYGPSEKTFMEARKQGILFIPFDLDQRPEVTIEDERVRVRGYDPVLREDVTFEPDWVGLATGLEPNPAGDLARIFGLNLTRDGFIREADSKWRPLEAGREGLFVCGLCRGPLRADEAMREGEAAAQKAFRILCRSQTTPARATARVRPALCSLCRTCIPVCPYQARFVDPVSGQIEVDPLSCQGCGACVAACPNGATTLDDHEEDGYMNAIEMAF
ncbi:MAG: FAD-dependent oxidoreductase [Proteobacteria bacterium]|nr:FAD-dependent oxidoreductase [Pseudomonadota bacterium]